MVDEYVIVLDTETTNSLDDPIAYDFGWVILNTKTQEILRERSFAVAEIFLNHEMMESAFYLAKVPQYWQEIWAGKRKIANFWEIRKIFAEDCLTFGVKQVYAHNARFDNRSANLTQRWLTKSRYRYFFPYGTEICDTLKMARSILNKNDEYANFCYENNYLTSRGVKRYTAEILFRFISGQNDFEEEHKGINDVLIEKEILLYCLKVNPEIDGKLWE